MKRCLLFGGGLESGILFFEMVKNKTPFEVLWYNYGQKSATQEMEAISSFCFRHNIQYRCNLLYMQGLTKNGSSLFGTGNNHVVDGRNLLFIMDALKHYDEIILGSHRNDTAGDASPEFISAIETVIEKSFRGEKRVIFPLYDADLKERIKPILKFEPKFLGQIFSCWTPVNHEACGKCKHCKKIEEYSSEAVLRGD